MTHQDHPIAATLDITRDVCPITFVKTKIELEDLAEGQILQVIVRAGESHSNVIRATREDGHRLLADEEHAPGIRRLLLQRGSH
jgi:tRNA 2-thiouridine synthesizing protein A